MLFTRGRAQEEAKQEEVFGIFIAAGKTETEERQQKEQRKRKISISRHNEVKDDSSPSLVRHGDDGMNGCD